MDSVGDRLKKARGGYSREKLASSLGRASKTVERWESGESFPTAPDLISLAEELDVSPAWLLTGEKAGALTAPYRSKQYVELTHYLVTASAAGGLATLDDSNVQAIWIHRYLLRKVLGIETDGHRVGIVEVSGDCMEPDLNDGDVVFFLETRQFAGAGRYVLWLNDQAEVKRLSRMSDGTVCISCDNREKYPTDEFLSPNADGTLILRLTGRPVDLRVIGPVVWPRQSVSQMLMQEVKRAVVLGYQQAAQGQLSF